MAATTAVRALGLMLWGGLAVTKAALVCASPSEQELLTEIPPISIESDEAAASSTQEELRRKFQEKLKQRPSVPDERRLADGTLEITTQLGRLCARPLPASVEPGVGGSIRLASPCASF